MLLSHLGEGVGQRLVEGTADVVGVRRHPGSIGEQAQPVGEYQAVANAPQSHEGELGRQRREGCGAGEADPVNGPIDAEVAERGQSTENTGGVAVLELFGVRRGLADTATSLNWGEGVASELGAGVPWQVGEADLLEDTVNGGLSEQACSQLASRRALVPRMETFWLHRATTCRRGPAAGSGRARSRRDGPIGGSRASESRRCWGRGPHGRGLH